MAGEYIREIAEDTVELKKTSQYLINQFNLVGAGEASIVYIYEEYIDGEKAETNPTKIPYILKLKKIPSIYNILIPYDFMLLINKELFKNFTPEKQNSALLEQLTRIEYNEKTNKYRLKKFDVQTMLPVIEAYGLWEYNLKVEHE